MADGRLLVAGGTKRYPFQTGGWFEGAKYVWQWDHQPQAGNPFGKWWQMADLEVDRWYPTVAYDGTAQHRGIVIGGTNWQTPSTQNPNGIFAVNSYEVVRIAFNAQPQPLLLPTPNDFDRKLGPQGLTPSTTFNLTSPSDRQYWGPLLPNNTPAFGDYPRIHALGILDPISPVGGGLAPRLFVSGFNGWGIRWPHDWTVDPTPVFGTPGFGTTFQSGQGYELGQNPVNGDALVHYPTSLLLPATTGGISAQIRRIGGGRPSVGASNLVETTHAKALPSSWQPSTPMAQGRYQANVVMLPTGDLFAIGGESRLQPTVLYNLTPELLVGGTTWKPMAPHAEPRNYHSAAILLPDARVLVCGGEARRLLAPNGKDYAIWEPPYYHLTHGKVPAQGIKVFDEATSATLDQDQVGLLGMHFATKYRAAWTNNLEPGIEVSSVVLMRPAALTHHDDGGQRMVRLVAEDDGSVPNGFAGSIVFSSPATERHAPPGWWMLFLVNSAGRPSQAYWVHLS